MRCVVPSSLPGMAEMLPLLRAEDRFELGLLGAEQRQHLRHARKG